MSGSSITPANQVQKATWKIIATLVHMIHTLKLRGASLDGSDSTPKFAIEVLKASDTLSESMKVSPL
jgi:hypothetical protein